MGNQAPKGGEAGKGEGKLLMCENDAKGGRRGSLVTIGLVPSSPAVRNASELESVAPSGASCVQSHIAAGEKQIAGPGCTGPQCV